MLCILYSVSDCDGDGVKGRGFCWPSSRDVMVAMARMIRNRINQKKRERGRKLVVKSTTTSNHGGETEINIRDEANISALKLA